MRVHLTLKIEYKMREDLDKKLVESYPNLYRDRFKSMNQTAMCWGFECGNGWYDLINELSYKLEKIIQKLDATTCVCGCDKNVHNSRGCTTVIPVTRWNDNEFNCSCVLFESDIPRAVQVKSKFGTLRFYVSHGNDKIYDLISEYESKSSKICELCGDQGELSSKNYWWSTLCEKCGNK